ncbi:SRPBCC domain-containing protein [Pseudoroseicyclus tamaricis]|uniref:Activator of Hsp90 ATPase homologue 1/2-like C-terminal domain-containing protein n=1 Tax=Pseudoroseicyclus tamaricis TaxID=2705421 RepID=A0A6B2JR41_9RHOB|nr:SRPBCC domain-containing protein [Pseudoroseicyclus tamaricis]NDV01017.1 hypothetical protein [Pseudoroseicyclus tamaricis]
MTDQPPALSPVETALHVPLRPAEAFRLFTERMEEWWPLATHSLSAGEGDLPLGLTMERHEGGRIVETKPDGTQGTWGRIHEWRPGERLGITWHVGRAEEEATRVEVTFTSTDSGTYIHLVHSGFEVLGAAAATIQASYGTGWPLVLGRYAALVRSKVTA